MDRITTRTQLINLIVNHAPSSAIKRACGEGTVNVLGGFRNVPPGTRPGWIVVVTSRFQRTWYVFVSANEETQEFLVREIRGIPWKYYIGREDQSAYSIYNGDDPRHACLARRLCGE